MTSVTKKQEALLDELLKGCEKPEDILGEHGLMRALQKRLVERVLEGELTEELGYEAHAPSGHGSGNSRNGKTRKTIQTATDQFEIEVPRDRNNVFEPQLVKKRQRRLPGIDEKVLALYARGYSTREIEGQLEELYGIDLSPSLVSTITDQVKEDIDAWQNRPLEPIYPILYFDALVVKSRQDGPSKNKAVHVALGINMDGEKVLLGLWMTENEGASFWLSVFTELKNRGVEDCFIACVDGLKGLPEAIETVFPQTQVQLCIVHKVRSSLKYVPWKERKAVAADLRAVYGAATLKEAENAFTRFGDKWDEKYPAISPSWKADWDRLTVFFDYPPAIRRVIYTTNAIESLNYSLRRLLKNRGAFPTDESIMKVFYLALKNISKKWTMPIQNWKQALNQFVIILGSERVIL
ncbi:MAG: IS256 family transposase [Proteobacteria bacterium]|nr:IS256 family transposase [Pseudomonadota bacterium]